jgi:hypothetical protein
VGWQGGAIQLLVIEAQSGGYSGMFVYSPVAGPGNLIASIAASAGVDPYGNAYPAGISSFTGELSGLQIVSSVFQGINFRIDQNGIFLYETVTTPPPPPPPPVPYFVGGNAVGAGTSTITFHPANPTSANDTLHLAANAAFGTTTVTGASDSQGNTYGIKVSDNTQIATTGLLADNTNNAGGTKALATSDLVTVTYSGTTGAKCASMAGVAGLQANPFDAAATPLNNAGQTTVIAGSVVGNPNLTSGALAEAAEVCIASLGSGNAGGAPTWAAGWTQLDRQQLGSGQFLSVAYLDPATAAAVVVGATLTAATRWGLLLAPLKE